MITDPYIGTLAERRKATTRQFIAVNGFCVVASALFGDRIPALLRATVSAGVPAPIFAAMSDDELMLTAQTVGGQFRQSGRLTFFEHRGRGVGLCDPDDAIALQEGHVPAGNPGGWDIP